MPARTLLAARLGVVAFLVEFLAMTLAGVLGAVTLAGVFGAVTLAGVVFGVLGMGEWIVPDATRCHEGFRSTGQSALVTLRVWVPDGRL